MDTHPGTATLWQSGRLAPRPAPRHLHLTSEQWIGATLLALAAVVLAIYVGVLERQVDRGELQRTAQQWHDAAPAPEATPDNSAYQAAAGRQDVTRVTTVSLAQ